MRPVFIAALLASLLPPRAPYAATPSASEDRPVLSDRFRRWLDEEVVWIINDHERSAFGSLADDASRDAFIKAFWEVRDPTPGTAENEVKTEHYKRVADANRLFGRSKAKPGSRSARGKLYIQLGPPQIRDTYPSSTRMYPLEHWFYQADRRTALPPFFNVIFFQPFGAGDYELYEPGIHGPEDLIGGMTANASEYDTDRKQALRQLNHVSNNLMRASLSLIPTDPPDVESGRIEPGSQRLVGQLADLKNALPVDLSYVERVLGGNPSVTVEYSFRDLGLAGAFHGAYLPDGSTLLHYSIEIPPESLTLTRYKDDISGMIQILGRIFREDGKTPVLQIDEQVELKFSKDELKRVERSPFAFQDIVPLLPGKYRATIIVRNAATRQFGSLEETFEIFPRTAGFSVAAPLLYSNQRDATEEASRPFAFASHLWYPRARRIIGANESIQVLVQTRYDPKLYGLDDELRIFWSVDDAEQVQAGARTRGSLRLRLNPAYDGGQAQTPIELPAQGLAPGPHVLHVVVEGHGDKRMERTAAFIIAAPRVAPTPWVYANRRGVDAAWLPVAYAEQYLALGDDKAAIDEYERAIAGTDTRDDVRMRLAEVLLTRKDFRHAVDAVRPAADRPQGNPYAMVLLGLALSGAGDGAEAIRVYERALVESPRSTQVLNLLGEERLRAGDVEQARLSFERSLAIEPDQEKIRTLMLNSGVQPKPATATP